LFLSVHFYPLRTFTSSLRLALCSPTTRNSKIHAPGGIRTLNPSKLAASDTRPNRSATGICRIRTPDLYFIVLK
jgi:hypothetical protein